MTAELEDLARGLADAELTVREQTAQELAELESEDAIPFLIHALEDDAASVRMWGAYGMTRLARPEDLEFLRDRLQTETSSLVKVWCAFGVANTGDRSAALTLAGFLDDPSLDVRNNCAEAILSLKRPAPVVPLLDARLAGKNRGARTWAAGILAGMGRPNALELWRESLLHPETRVDAAIVASHLHAPDAARDLVRLVAELIEEELEAPVDRAGGAPLIQLLTTPLAALGLAELLENAQRDPTLTEELLLLLARGGSGDPDVLGEIATHFESQPPQPLATRIVALLEEQDAEVHPALFAGWTPWLPEATLLALELLPQLRREAVFKRVIALGEDPGTDLLRYAPLFELLRNGPWASRFQELPELSLPDTPEFLTDPLGSEIYEEPGEGLYGDEAEETAAGEEETFEEESYEPESSEFPEGEAGELPGMEEGDDLVQFVQQLAAGEELADEDRERAENFLSELGLSAEEFVAELNQSEAENAEVGPRSADVLAQRALVLGAMLSRMNLETLVAAGEVKKPDASRKVESLRAWLVDESLEPILEPLERDLIDLPAGEWSDEDRQQTGWSAESLGVLLWALEKRESMPGFEGRTQTKELLGVLPLMEPTADFVGEASVRETEQLEHERELIEMYLWRGDQEQQARRVEAGDIPEDLYPEVLVEELESEGNFPAKALEAKLGRNGMLAEAVRTISRNAAERLKEVGAIKQLVGGDFAFLGKPVGKLDEEELDALRSLCFERQRALAWAERGGSWE